MTVTTSLSGSPHTLPAIRRAVMRAMLAPSVHNTQPWRFVAGPTSLDVFADLSRMLSVIDPDGRELLISCGAALLGARVSLAAAGVAVTVDVLPDPRVPDHLARIVVVDGTGPDDPDAVALDVAADARHTNRRAFTAAPVPPEIVARLQVAAAREGAFLHPVTTEPGLSIVRGLTAEAEGVLFSDPAYRSELRQWAGRSSGSHDDGIPPQSLPRASTVTDPLPTRAFDQNDTGRLPASTGTAQGGSVLLLATDSDDRRAWLRAGQALGRVLAELTRDGLVAGLYSQLTEIHRIRAQVRSTLALGGYPQLLLRVGHAERTAATPRRPVTEVLTVTATPA